MSKETKEVKTEPKPEVKVEAPRTVLSEFKLLLLQLEKAVNTKDIKMIQKASNSVRKFKKAIKAHHLKKIYAAFFPNLAINFDESLDFDPSFSEELELAKPQVSRLGRLIEVELYIQTIHLAWLLQSKAIAQAVVVAKDLLAITIQQNKRYLGTLQGIIYFYYSRIQELNGDLRSIREILLAGYRTACQNHDEQCQAILINLLLRNFLHYNQYEQAHNFLNKTEFPEHAPGNELVRYLYYTGLIHAIRGEYQIALQNLTQSLRKAPDTTAFDFKAQAQKVAALVELLLGEIPNRETFTQSDSQQVLYPYYRIVSTVMRGNLKDFQQEVTFYENVFRRDKLYNLIQRLPQIVIKTGLRRINISYSRISLQDIAQKLNLPLNSNPEQIVAKAIRDGTLNAAIDHESQTVITQEKNDIYSTNEPQEAFARRIELSLNLYKQAVKALQYSNPQYDYSQNQKEELTADELLNMIDISDF